MANRLKILSTVIFALIVFVMLAGLVFVNILYIRLTPVEKNFLTPWLGMRTFLEIGSDPYGEPASQRAQIIYYGTLAEPEQDPLILHQPFASVILYFPFALFNDYTTARIIWMVLLDLILIGSAFLCLNLFEWKLPIILKAAYILVAIFGNQALLPLFENDQVIIIFIFILIGLVGLQRGLDELSGAAFALALFQPSATGIFCLLTFWWVIQNRRWRIIWGALMAWGFLIFTSFALYPGWLLPFIRSFRLEFDFNNYQSTYGILSKLWPAIGTKVASALTIGVIILLLLEWRAALHHDFRWYLWIASLTLATSPLIGIPTIAVNKIVLLLPLTFILSVFSERVRGKNQWVFIALLLGFIFLGGWTNSIGLLNIKDLVELKELTFFLPSFLLICGLYWIRWWATRPPHTWIETINLEKN